MEISLTQSTLARLRRPVNGRGGFQQLLRRLQPQVTGNVLVVGNADQEKLVRYSHSYGRGGFQCRTAPAAAEVQQALNFDASDIN